MSLNIVKIVERVDYRVGSSKDVLSRAGFSVGVS